MIEKNTEKKQRPDTTLISELQERAKELKCLYRIEALLSQPDRPLKDIFKGIIEAIPYGWQFPDACQVQVQYKNEVHAPPEYVDTPWVMFCDINVHDNKLGRIDVSYKSKCWPEDEEPFLDEERKLLETIATRLSGFIFQQQLKQKFEESNISKTSGGVSTSKREWRGALHLLLKTQPRLLEKVSRKMMNYLGWKGIPEAKNLLHRYDHTFDDELSPSESNQPLEKVNSTSIVDLSENTFRVAEAYLSDDEILERIQKWVNEDRTGFLVKIFSLMNVSINEIYDAIHRYQHLVSEGIELSQAAYNGIRVSLISRFLNDQLNFVSVAKRYIEIGDFSCLIERILYPPNSKGHLGGKSAGLFLARQILKRAYSKNEKIGEFKTPKTWYIASDGVLNFVNYNNLDEVFEQKYKDIEEVRQDYPHIIQVFKNSSFSPEMMKGLSHILDDFGEVPLIVRSSSLLEDRLGTAFSGKYKSLFLANQGNKKKRLEALMDAVAEVYASVFSPDPIEYRAERGLLDFNEEMAIMIQEVVGKRVGKYFFPAFAGVAFSNNELRWSPRIKREDGLLRLVPGLGTRAVDRVADDYPVLVAPGQPKLRVNVSAEELIRYSPKKIDVINLEKNCFETKDIVELVKECKDNFPALNKMVSVLGEGMIQRPVGLTTDFEKDTFIVTFEGLLSRTPFLTQMSEILKTLKEIFGFPVDIEFASDGDDLYLLQCRPQSRSRGDEASEIPKNVPVGDILFTANKYISNGSVPEITHIVYVDPSRYATVSKLSDLISVGHAVSRLNNILPKRHFILMGPGRWGSRGDIKLGVRVTYSDINNTAMLIEIARKQGNYVPDLSFGTHFFQDLVEASIRYLPLYPDENGVKFNERFFLASPNALGTLVPEYAFLSDVLHVIDVQSVTGGKMAQVLMNADLEQGMGMLSHPTSHSRASTTDSREQISQQTEEHWFWRLRMAECIAASINPDKFGIKALYLLGSSKNATAGPESDIDMLVHFSGNEEQRKLVEMKVECCSRCLAELNYMRTGVRKDGLLDVQILTDEEIKQQQGFASKIGASTDAARNLPLGLSHGR